MSGPIGGDADHLLSSEPEPEEEPGVSWTIIGVIIIVFLCFTIIPAMIFFMDR